MGGAKSLPTDYRSAAHLRLVTSRALFDPDGLGDERRVLRGISAFPSPSRPTGGVEFTTHDLSRRLAGTLRRRLVT